VIRKLHVFLAAAAMVPFAAALGQAQATTDSIEIAAARFARGRYAAFKSISFEPRVRTAKGFVDSRSAAHVADMAASLGADTEKLDCDHTTPACRLKADVGLVFRSPKISGDTATVEVEVYTQRAVGSETYVLLRRGQSWHVISLGRGSSS